MKNPVFKLFYKEIPHWLTDWNAANYNPPSREVTQIRQNIKGTDCDKS
jgi:hypothetical protein